MYRRNSTLRNVCLMWLMIACFEPARVSGDKPPADPVEVVDLYHGEKVIDRYRWLEDAESDATKTWVTDQDRKAREFAAADPRHTTFEKEIGAIASSVVSSPPVIRGGRMFYAEYEPTGPQRALSLFVLDSPSARPRLLIDRKAFLEKTGQSPVRFFCSDDGRYVAFGATKEGTVWETVRIIDVGRGTVLDDSVANVHTRLASINWTSDSTGFYYEAYEREGQSGVGAGRLMFHKFGAGTGPDSIVYDPHDRNTFVSAFTSPGGQYLIITERHGSDSGNRVVIRKRDPLNPQICALVDQSDATFAYAGQIGSRVWFRTDLKSPNGRVVAMNLSCSSSGHMDEIVPESPSAISTWFGFAPLGAVVAGGRLLVTRIEDGRSVIRIYSLQGRLQRTVTLPYEGSIWTGFIGSENQDTVYYSLSGLLDPGTVYGLNIASGRSRLFRAANLPYNLNDFVTEFVQIPADDGSHIPTFIVRRHDTQRNAQAPAVLYGYGFGGWNAAPYFYPLMAAFVNHGGIWAVPVIRGDGGYGTQWHLAGRRENKPRGISDYLEVTSWLVNHQYTSPDRMIANASSAGGALVAAAVVRKPDLYRVLLLDYPLIDVLRYDRFTYARGWIAEYGTSDNDADYPVLRSYSPYHNLVQGICYPATFIAPGENDGLTPPFHAYKFAAALQAASGCLHPFLVRVSWGAGHASGAGLQQSVENWTDQLSFLDEVLPGDLLH